MFRRYPENMWHLVFFFIILLMFVSCNFLISSELSSSDQPIQNTPTFIKTRSIAPSPIISIQRSVTEFQVFILNPIIT